MANNNNLLKNFGNFVNRVGVIRQRRLSLTNIRSLNLLLQSSTVSCQAKLTIPSLISLTTQTLKPARPASSRISTTFSKDILTPWSVLTCGSDWRMFLRCRDAVMNGYKRTSSTMLFWVSRHRNTHDSLLKTLPAEHPRRAQRTILLAINLIYAISAAVHPFMPSTSESIIEQLNAPPRTLPDTFAIDIYPGHKIGTPSLLFTRIDEKMEDVWRRKFGGAQAEAPKPELSKKQLAKQAKAAKAAKEAVKVPDTPEAKALNDSITAQGSRIRDIKSGAIKEADLDKEVAQLKQLKADMDAMIKQFDSL